MAPDSPPPSDTPSLLNTSSTDTTPTDTPDYTLTTPAINPDNLPDPLQARLETTSIDKDFILDSLDELLLIFIGLNGSMNGNDLITTFAQHFGVSISPGTLYPRLHALEDDGILELNETVQAKEYLIADWDAADARITDTVIQQLKLVLLCQELWTDVPQHPTDYPIDELADFDSI